MAGQTFLSNAFGSAKALVEIAFGADITAAAGTWAWTDVSADLMNAAQVRITQGRTDETSTAQAASCSFTLLNTTGKYTPFSPMSSLYPNVKKGTPVRVSVDVGSGFKTMFVGFAAGFTPAWDTSAKLATAQVSAGGLLRRLGQGNSPLRSALYRTISTLAPIAYWPMEDGADATAGASAVAGVEALKPITAFDFSGVALPDAKVSWASGGNPGGSAPLPDLSSKGRLTAHVPMSAAVTGWRVEFSFRSDSLAGAQYTSLMHINTAGPGLACIEVLATDLADGGLYIDYIDPAGNFGPITTSGVRVDDGLWHRITIVAFQSGGGADTSVNMYVDGVAVVSGAHWAGVTFGQVTSLDINPGQFYSVHSVQAMGHVAVWPSATPVNTYPAHTGYLGETADTRIARICAEQGIPATVSGTSNIPMGPQPAATLLSVLRECEATDGGLLLDGFDAGLVYVTRSSRYNLAADITVDASAGQLAPPFAPVDDDQRIRNDFTVSRSGGSSVQVEDLTGALGVNKIGDYDSSLTVNTSTDDVLPQIGGWNVHLGTVEGLRYPNLNLDFVAATSLANTFLVAGYPGQIRLDVTNLTSKATQAPPDVIQQMVEGWTATFDQTSFDAALNCSPFEPWRVASIEGGTYPLRIEAEALTLAAPGATTVATSLNVANAGLPYTTTASNPGDFPFDMDLEGEQIRVTAIAGTTFTVTRSINGVVKSHLAGAVLKLWRPVVIGL